MASHHANPVLVPDRLLRRILRWRRVSWLRTAPFADGCGDNRLGHLFGRNILDVPVCTKADSVYGLKQNS